MECPFGCNKYFNSSRECQEHVQLEHPEPVERPKDQPLTAFLGLKDLRELKRILSPDA